MRISGFISKYLALPVIVDGSSMPDSSTIAGLDHDPTTMTARRTHHQPLAAARGRLLLWVGAIVLLLQLFAAVGHDHESEPTFQDCVACSVQAQSHAAPPTLPAAPAAGAWVLAQVLAPAAISARPPRFAGYLLPQPHAPPASSFSA